MNEKGFSLLEVTAAVGLISIAAIGILPSFMVHLQSNTRSEIRAGAVLAVEQTMEGLRLVDPATLPDSGQSAPQLITIGERSYTVVTSYCVKSDFCDTNARHLEVEVFHGGRRIYGVETVYTQLL